MTSAKEWPKGQGSLAEMSSPRVVSFQAPAVHVFRRCRRAWCRRRLFLVLIMCVCGVSLVILSITQRDLLANSYRQGAWPMNDALIKPRFLEKIERYQNNFLQEDDLDNGTSMVNVSHGSSFDRLYVKNGSVPLLFKEWLNSMHTKCDRNFQTFGRIAAVTHDVIIDQTKSIGRRGGERFEMLMNQRENEEFYTFRRGFMEVPCKAVPEDRFRGNNHLNKWMASMTTYTQDEAVDDVIPDFTIAITRYEYVNLYHTMTDFYNAFLIMAFFNKSQRHTNILIVDGHPRGGLDPVWGTLFKSVTRLGQLKRRTRFRNLVFGIMGYDSPIFRGVTDTSIRTLPLSDEFRDFFLSSYNIQTDAPLNCRSLNVLFIWRRNYIAHPRNPSGNVHRKIHNEQELVRAVSRAYPTFNVLGIQADRCSMGEQLKYISETDILIGMHGAALSHSLFLQRGRAMIELMPSYVNPVWKNHFIVMAKWRRLIYERWVNTHSSLEHKGFYTTVPPGVLLGFLRTIVEDMCVGERQ